MLGANDGIISTASLIVGVAAAATTQNDVLIAGVAGLVAGATAMAAGEYFGALRMRPHRDNIIMLAVALMACAFRRSRPPIPTDRDHLFRSIATMWRGC